jgi:hypothetical protein
MQATRSSHHHRKQNLWISVCSVALRRMNAAKEGGEYRGTTHRVRTRDAKEMCALHRDGRLEDFATDFVGICRHWPKSLVEEARFPPSLVRATSM